MDTSKVRVEARDEAAAKMREAGCWWEAFDRANHEICFWTVRLAARRFRLKKELGRWDGGRPNIVIDLRRMVDEAHDLKMSADERIMTCAEQARGLEMMARIFWEEGEETKRLGGQVQKLPHPVTWTHGQD